MEGQSAASAGSNLAHVEAAAGDIEAMSLLTLPWDDLPQQLQERIYESFYPRERRIFRRLNKACRQQACHQLVKRLTVVASRHIPGNHSSTTQTLFQRFSNLHTLNLADELSIRDIRLLGKSTVLVHLKCRLQDKFTNVCAATVASHFPNLQLLDLACLGGISDTALAGLCTLTKLTTLLLQPRTTGLVRRLPFELLDNFLAELSGLKSLAVMGLLMPDADSSNSFLQHLTGLTRLVLNNMGIPVGGERWSALCAPVAAQLTGLRDLELPCDDSHLALALRSLTNLTRLCVPKLALDLQSLAAGYDGPLFPQLQILVCVSLAHAITQQQALPSCIDFHLVKYCTPQDVTSALRQCPALQRLTITPPLGADALQQLEAIRQALSAAPAVQVRVAFHLSEQMPWVQALNHLQLWGSLRAVQGVSIDSLDMYVEPLIAAFSQLRSLEIVADEAEQADLLALCTGLPLLREIVLFEYSDNKPFSGNPGDCAQLLASSALATRQLRISIPELPVIQVLELNRELQDLSCDGLTIDNTVDLNFW